MNWRKELAAPKQPINAPRWQQAALAIMSRAAARGRARQDKLKAARELEQLVEFAKAA